MSSSWAIACACSSVRVSTCLNFIGCLLSVVFSGLFHGVYDEFGSVFLNDRDNF